MSIRQDDGSIAVGSLVIVVASVLCVSLGFGSVMLCSILCPSSFTIILLRKKKLIALISLSFLEFCVT